MSISKEKETEKYIAADYLVFPGISVIYQESHTKKGELKEREWLSDSTFAIFHCREGRMECNVAGSFCYISPGDLLIARSEQIASPLCFPLKHYHGIAVCIDTEKTPECLSCFLSDVAVQPKRIEEKFCGDKAYFVACSNLSFEHIFSELYHVPDKIRQGYSKIKILELMLFLSAFDMETGKSEHPLVSPRQAELAKGVADYLTENMYEKITLELAAKNFTFPKQRLKVLSKRFMAYPSIPI